MYVVSKTHALTTGTKLRAGMHRKKIRPTNDKNQPTNDGNRRMQPVKRRVGALRRYGNPADRETNSIMTQGKQPICCFKLAFYWFELPN
jgi:hypothetical protein